MSWMALFVAGWTLSGGLAAPDSAVNSGRCRDGRTWTTSTVEQGQMLVLINQTRARSARPPLTRTAVLDRMAMAHAADMACRKYFDHANPERESLQDRLKRAAGASVSGWRRLAEVIGTSVTPQRQLERWLSSPAHRRAVLEAEHEHAGVGLVRIAGSRYTTYWVVDLVADPR